MVKAGLAMNARVDYFLLIDYLIYLTLRIDRFYFVLETFGITILWEKDASEPQSYIGSALFYYNGLHEKLCLRDWEFRVITSGCASMRFLKQRTSDLSFSACMGSIRCGAE